METLSTGQELRPFHVTGKEAYPFVPDALSRLCMNNSPPPPAATNSMLMVLRPAVHLDPQAYRIIKRVHNKEVGHWGRHICKKLLRSNGHGDIPNRDMQEFVRQCPACEVMNRLKITIRHIHLHLHHIIHSKLFIWIIWTFTSGLPW